MERKLDLGSQRLLTVASLSLRCDPELPDVDFCFTTSTSEILVNDFSKSGWCHLIGWSLHQLAGQVLPGSKEDSLLPGLLIPAVEESRAADQRPTTPTWGQEKLLPHNKQEEDKTTNGLTHGTWVWSL